MESSEKEFLKSRIAKDQKSLKEQEEKEQYEKVAKQLKTAYDSFVAEGFSEEQSFWFVAQIIKKAFKNS